MQNSKFVFFILQELLSEISWVLAGRFVNNVAKKCCITDSHTNSNSTLGNESCVA